MIVIKKITRLTSAADLFHCTSGPSRQTINKHHPTTVEKEPQKKLPDDVPGMNLKQSSQTRSSSDVGKFSCRYTCSWECTTKVLTTANTTCISAIPAAWEKEKAFLLFFFVGQLMEMLGHGTRISRIILGGRDLLKVIDAAQGHPVHLLSLNNMQTRNVCSQPHNGFFPWQSNKELRKLLEQRLSLEFTDLWRCFTQGLHIV